MVTFAMPTFWLGLMLALLFGLRLDWLPVSGYGEGVGGILRSLALPALTLGLFLAPMLIERCVRALSRNSEPSMSTLLGHAGSPRLGSSASTRSATR